MSLLIAGVAVAAIVVAYFERKGIKAEADKVKAAAEAKVATFEQALRIKESQVRAKVAQDVAIAFTKLRLDARAEGSLAVDKVEAEIKKAI